jgi:antitoxin component YwqK of YwqJK toxin-antitoxin module
MNHWFSRLLAHGTLAAAIVFASQLSMHKVLAADTNSSGAKDKGESITVEPYKGPPIYLDEVGTPPPPTIVERQTATKNYPDGTLHWERELVRLSDDHFVADGYYREYYPNGKLFVEGTYKNGRQEGEWTYWHDNGTKSRQVTYKNGFPDGEWESHRADGTLEAMRAFKNGKRDGGWIIYDDTGKQPLRVEQYKEGKADGEWKLWFPSGQLQRQIEFKNGKRDGKAVEFREDGSKVLEGSYQDGKVYGTMTLWSTDGRKIVQEYDNGRLVSERAETVKSAE